MSFAKWVIGASLTTGLFGMGLGFYTGREDGRAAAFKEIYAAAKKDSIYAPNPAFPSWVNEGKALNLDSSSIMISFARFRKLKIPRDCKCENLRTFQITEEAMKRNLIVKDEVFAVDDGDGFALVRSGFVLGRANKDTRTLFKTAKEGSFVLSANDQGTKGQLQVKHEDYRGMELLPVPMYQDSVKIFKWAGIQ